MNGKNSGLNRQAQKTIGDDEEEYSLRAGADIDNRSDSIAISATRFSIKLRKVSE